MFQMQVVHTRSGVLFTGVCAPLAVFVQQISSGWKWMTYTEETYFLRNSSLLKLQIFWHIRSLWNNEKLDHFETMKKIFSSETRGIWSNFSKNYFSRFGRKVFLSFKGRWEKVCNFCSLSSLKPGARKGCIDWNSSVWDNVPCPKRLI